MSGSCAKRFSTKGISGRYCVGSKNPISGTVSEVISWSKHVILMTMDKAIGLCSSSWIDRNRFKSLVHELLNLCLGIQLRVNVNSPTTFCQSALISMNFIEYTSLSHFKVKILRFLNHEFYSHTSWHFWSTLKGDFKELNVELLKMLIYHQTLYFFFYYVKD